MQRKQKFVYIVDIFIDCVANYLQRRICEGVGHMWTKEFPNIRSELALHVCQVYWLVASYSVTFKIWPGPVGSSIAKTKITRNLSFFAFAKFKLDSAEF